MACSADDYVRATRDIRQAYSLLSRLRGISAAESVAVLHDHAALTVVSVHAAALAVRHAVGEAHRRVPTTRGDTTTDTAGPIVLYWQSREKAHVAVSGVCSEDLAARLQQVVERALSSGAIHLIVNTRGTTGVAPEFDDMIAWTGRRLWARRGSLTLRAPISDTGGSDSRAITDMIA
jgi:hypothetical protein